MCVCVCMWKNCNIALKITRLSVHISFAVYHFPIVDCCMFLTASNIICSLKHVECKVVEKIKTLELYKLIDK